MPSAEGRHVPMAETSAAEGQAQGESAARSLPEPVGIRARCYPSPPLSFKDLPRPRFDLPPLGLHIF